MEKAKLEMNFGKAFIIACSMYSKIPMPTLKWEENDMKYAICFFPFVGLILGFLEYVLLMLGIYLGCHELTIVCLMLSLILLVTGGIHVDGYMDTSDALHSYGEREKKLQILKDPHIGAFAVIRLALYGLLLAAGLLEVVRKILAVLSVDFLSDKSFGTLLQQSIQCRPLLLLCIIFPLARVCSGLSVVYLKNAKKEGILYTFASGADKKVARGILWGELCILAIVMILLQPISAWMMLAACAVCYSYYRWRAYKEFGGITGDLAGWFLCNLELVLVWVICL